MPFIDYYDNKVAIRFGTLRTKASSKFAASFAQAIVSATRGVFLEQVKELLDRCEGRNGERYRSVEAGLEIAMAVFETPRSQEPAGEKTSRISTYPNVPTAISSIAAKLNTTAA